MASCHMLSRRARWSALASWRRRYSVADSSVPSRAMMSASTAAASRWTGFCSASLSWAWSAGPAGARPERERSSQSWRGGSGAGAVAGAGAGAFGQWHGPAVVDDAEPDDLVADPAGQLAHHVARAGQQDHVLMVGEEGHGHLRGAFDDFLGTAAVDPAAGVVDVGDGGVSGAQPQAGVAVPLVGEPDRLRRPPGDLL